MTRLNDPTFTMFSFKSGLVSSKDLLNCYLEFVVLVRESQAWQEEQLADNPPRLYRLKQLNAILRAFDINDLVEFRNGDFIEKDAHDRYEEVISLISLGSACVSIRDDLQACFCSLLQYREEIEKGLWFGSGYYHIGSKILNTTYNHIWQSIAEIRASLSSIDQIIIGFISPDKKRIPIEHLVCDFNFPDVDIASIDMEWL
ncbi:MAG: hypothetical protein F9K32_06390 [Desulfobulbaceae bacterium]|nr:MAG: hypothetical protein F9K32_06390 [Desulfobulbaceae bacterium]